MAASEAERIVDEYRWDDGSHSETEDAAYRQAMIDAIDAAIAEAVRQERDELARYFAVHAKHFSAITPEAVARMIRQYDINASKEQPDAKA